MLSASLISAPLYTKGAYTGGRGGWLRTPPGLRPPSPPRGRFPDSPGGVNRRGASGSPPPRRGGGQGEGSVPEPPHSGDTHSCPQQAHQPVITRHHPTPAKTFIFFHARLLWPSGPASSTAFCGPPPLASTRGPVSANPRRRVSWPQAVQARFQSFAHFAGSACDRCGIIHTCIIRQSSAYL
jgi:hypothetical protein